MRINILFELLLVGIMLNPILAVTNLETYTQAGNYVTPAYGHYLGGDYQYTYFGVSWNNLGLTDKFENNGYYSIFNSLTHYEIFPFTQVKASQSGVVSFCVDSFLFVSPQTQCQVIGSYSTPGSYQTLGGGAINLNSMVSTETGSILKMYFRIDFSGGGSQESWKYDAYWNIDNLYNNYIPISVSSSNNLSEGIVTITLNSSITSSLENTSCVIYDNDGQELTLSGTRSCLTITDSTGSVAYPYYLENYKGGFYNYSRNTTNTTIIKVYVNENTTLKALRVYFNTTYLNGTSLPGTTYLGQYNTTYRTDENNNPFVIHQVFSDWRWNSSFAKTLFNITGTMTNYVRNTSLRTPNSADLNMYYPLLNNINKLNYTYSTSGVSGIGDGTHMTIYSNFNTTEKVVSFNNVVSGGGYSETHFLYNLSASSASVQTSGTIEIKSNSSNISISSTSLPYYRNYFNFTLVNFGSQGQFNGIGIFGLIKNVDYISSTNTISPIVNSTPLNLSNIPILSINSHTPIDTRLNRIPIYFDINTNLAGSVYCDVFNSTKVSNTVNIPLSNLTDYNLILYLEYTNQTEFYNLNNSQILYKCNFLTSSGSFNTSYRSIFFNNELIYLSGISPVHYFNYPNNNTITTISFSYNYLLSEHITTLAYGFGETNCTDIYQGKCIRYVENKWATIGIAYVSILGEYLSYVNITASSPFTQSSLIPNYAGSGRCYDFRFWFLVGNTTETGNTSGYEINDQLFCINASDIIEGEGSGNIPPINQTSLSNGIKNAIIGASLNCYTNYTGNATEIFKKPQCATGTVMYKLTDMNGRNGFVSSILLAGLIVFWSFPFLALVAGFYLSGKGRNMSAFLGVTFILMLFFILAGFSNFDIINLVTVAFVGLILYMKSKG